MRHLLREQGFNLVAEASDARSGFPLIDSKQPNVVLLDLRLPGMDGVTATRELQTRAPSTKVMILSAYTRQHEVDEAWAAGVHGYVTKMQAADELRAAIERVVAGERYLSPGLKPSERKDRSGPL
ncbi:MAG TPA: response regulator transcription factor, partial [Polyangia bacterium]